MDKHTRPSNETRANSAFFAVMETAPLGLLISAALGLAIVGVFQFIFYLMVIPSDWPAALSTTLSVCLALFFEGLGFYFLVTTVRDFAAGARKEGWLGLAATVILWAYALWEGWHISMAFDTDNPEGFAAIFGIVGTIICIVRVVELRITLTVTSAVKRHAAEAMAKMKMDDLVSSYNSLLEELNAYREMETAAAAQKAELQRLQEEANQETKRKQQEENMAELARLRRKLATAEKTDAAGSAGIGKVSRPLVERKAIEFIKKNGGMKPSQANIAQMIGVTTRSIRSAFPNGSWDAFISTLQTADQHAHV